MHVHNRFVCIHPPPRPPPLARGCPLTAASVALIALLLSQGSGVGSLKVPKSTIKRHRPRPSPTVRTSLKLQRLSLDVVERTLGNDRI